MKHTFSDEIIKTIAVRHGVGDEEVRNDIEHAISMSNLSSHNLSPNGQKPGLEDILLYAAVALFFSL